MFTDTPDSVLAILTDVGRTNFAKMTMGDISFVVDGFAVGRGGYDSINPVKIVPIDAASTSLIDQFFPIIGTTKSVEAVEKPYPSTVVINCRLGRDESISALGEIGVWAKVVDSSDINEIGTTFLLAIGHFPISVKTLRKAVLYKVIIQF
jgi:hypothetical protein